MSTVGRNLVRHGRSQKKPCETIHRASCPVMKGRRKLPWDWAEGRDVYEWLSLDWFRACQVCRPDLMHDGDKEAGR